eukprot:CAMPEP_0114119916 /NCGR_PEP_ID=MMETSP0043_2-20121206/6366_1 /TAXON_ID=464988 /ORGANISM="Hemiselmis andersenii, Strain CCMP644" /LENGTH=166 /DNA_ID=CAMNT_0001212495 /DNA_START=17 /DNA_END=514 /DNA_ORIENTATION=-
MLERSLRTLVGAIVILGLAVPAGGQNWCCKTVSFDSQWCQRDDCLGAGCLDGQSGVCSPLSDCICKDLVPYRTKNFCVLFKSCQRSNEDLEFAKDIVQLYTQRAASDSCIDALTRAICSYHFPLCESDSKDFKYICDSVCQQVKRNCGNVTLPYFAAEGSRCKPPG